ncbi:hypothetical protein SUGI_1010210 [Cryptomeria japonica]|nr:hypothetical protein SUGI_1010210 [Cryptomeria japonica]
MYGRIKGEEQIKLPIACGKYDPARRNDQSNPMKLRGEYRQILEKIGREWRKIAVKNPQIVSVRALRI